VRRGGVLLASLLLAACAHSSVRVDSAGGTVTTNTRVWAGYHGDGAVAAWALIGIGLIASQYSDTGSEPPDALDAKRRVNEQDCTKPIRDPSANLKCR
jgi:hypothetical protein